MLFNALFTQTTVFLTNFIEQKPGAIIGPISTFLGWILNFIFNVVYTFTVNNSLGLTIILFTVVARSLMLPMAFKQQKSMVAMRKIQPETEKIKEKYGNTKDPELQRKMNAEIQALYAKNKVNPLSGCLPMFVTLPIFFALSYMLRQSFAYIDAIGNIYNGISSVLIKDVSGYLDILKPIIAPMIRDGSHVEIDLALMSDISRALNHFATADWTSMMEQVRAVSVPAYNAISALLVDKSAVESFFSIDLVQVSGLAWPGIIIPILTGLTTFLSTWILNKQQGNSGNANMKTQQTIMLVVMPLMMAWMTKGFASGVGIYWIVGSIYQTIQQVILNNYYVKKDTVLVSVTDVKTPKPIITLDKSKKNKKGDKA